MSLDCRMRKQTGSSGKSSIGKKRRSNPGRSRSFLFLALSRLQARQKPRPGRQSQKRQSGGGKNQLGSESGLLVVAGGQHGGRAGGRHRGFQHANFHHERVHREKPEKQKHDSGQNEKAHHGIGHDRFGEDVAFFRVGEQGTNHKHADRRVARGDGANRQIKRLGQFDANRSQAEHGQAKRQGDNARMRAHLPNGLFPMRGAGEQRKAGRPHDDALGNQKDGRKQQADFAKGGLGDGHPEKAGVGNERGVLQANPFVRAFLFP